jgi:hypothetical protein
LAVSVAGGGVFYHCPVVGLAALSCCTCHFFDIRAKH